MDHKAVYRKGNDAFAMGQYEQALNFFLPVFDVYSEEPNLLLKISQCYEQLGAHDEAIEFLERLLNTCVELGEYKKAIAVCKRILSLDPDDTEVVLKLANIFRKIKQYGEASYYYKIVAQHYEYAGFMDKALEILNIIKELGQESVDDLLEIVKNEYKKGAKAKADKNIDEIIKELKEGCEYRLLELALNLALSNNPGHLDYIIDLADLSFRTLKLERCVKLCLSALYLDKKNSRVVFMLVKALWALGWDDYASRFLELLISSELETDNEKTPELALKFRSRMLEVEKERAIKINPEEGKDLNIDDDLSYLKDQEFTKVDHNDIRRKITMQELEERVDEAMNDKTSIIDVRRKNKYPPKMLEGLKEAEILVAEEMYDKAGLKLFELLEDFPGNEDLKDALNRVLKLSSIADSVPIYNDIDVETDVRTTREMVSDLERYLDSRDEHNINEEYISEEKKIKKIMGMFNSKLMEVLSPEDYNTYFDLGIAYMELYLWEDAYKAFNKVIHFMEHSEKKNEKRILESRIYYAYSMAQSDIELAKQSIKDLEEIVKGLNDNKKILEVLYYLALCYEIDNDKEKAKEAYKKILNIEPVYRDVELRIRLLER